MVKDVYFLTVHGPYEEPGAPAPVNGLIVHALTLLHPDLPRPDAGRSPGSTGDDTGLQCKV